MKKIYILKIEKVKGVEVESTNTYAFEEERQVDKMISDIVNDPNAKVGQNPGTLLYKDTIYLFEAGEQPQANIPELPKSDPFRRFSKGVTFSWSQGRPFR